MKERPIIFNGNMVRAILDGRKTQERRPVKPQPIWVGHPSVPFRTNDANPNGIIRCPYGVRGDRLWVRETWLVRGTDYERQSQNQLSCSYRADVHPDYTRGRWHPSIHMPRWASRITLEVAAVRVERVQDITEEDAKEEGVQIGEDRSFVFQSLGIKYTPHRSAFKVVWQSIYGTWDANPWVWAVEFRRIPL